MTVHVCNVKPDDFLKLMEMDFYKPFFENRAYQFESFTMFSNIRSRSTYAADTQSVAKNISCMAFMLARYSRMLAKEF